MLVVPTGSGKMTVPLLAALLVRLIQGVPRGITLITQPLSALQLEQVGNAICPVAVLSMSGALSCSHEELYNGDYPVLLAHPERRARGSSRSSAASSSSPSWRWMSSTLFYTGRTSAARC